MINLLGHIQDTVLTTREVVRDVMGVPMAAVDAIARQQGIDITKDSACIDEKALSAYADAYVRKMKAYFTRAKANLHQMGPDEMLLFNQFCNSFKKPTNNDSSLSWNAIDQQAIRDEFIREVKANTPKNKPQRHTVIDVISDAIFAQLEYIGETCSFAVFEDTSDINPQDWLEEKKQTEDRSLLLRNITGSIYYRTRVKQSNYHQPISGQIRAILLSARFHIYRSDDEDHIEEPVLIVNDHTGGHKFNSVLRMVA